MKKLLLFVPLLIISVAFITVKMNGDEFTVLCGKSWNGKLTYVDYSNGKQVSIPATLSVRQLSGDSYIFSTEYPKEPQENQLDTIRILNKGTFIDNERVIHRSNSKDTLRIISERRGEVNGLPATFRYTYLISSNYYSKRKQEKADKTQIFKERNKFEFRR